MKVYTNLPTNYVERLSAGKEFPFGQADEIYVFTRPGELVNTTNKKIHLVQYAPGILEEGVSYPNISEEDVVVVGPGYKEVFCLILLSGFGVLTPLYRAIKNGNSYYISKDGNVDILQFRDCWSRILLAVLAKLKGELIKEDNQFIEKVLSKEDMMQAKQEMDLIWEVYSRLSCSKTENVLKDYIK